MKFGENLKSNLTHEWKKQYIDYEKLKGTFSRVPVSNVLLFDVIDIIAIHINSESPEADRKQVSSRSF